mgnify:CR=1 FL=1
MAVIRPQADAGLFTDKLLMRAGQHQGVPASTSRRMVSSVPGEPGRRKSADATTSVTLGSSSAITGFQRRGALFEIGVQRALLRAQLLLRVLQLFDLAAQRAHLRGQLIDALRKLHQALVVDDTLNAAEPAIHVIDADLRGIRL